MYTINTICRPKSTYLFASVEVRPTIPRLGEIAGGSPELKLRAILGREIASNFGVGSQNLIAVLAIAVDDILSIISDVEKSFFLGLQANGGLELHGGQMTRSREIIMGLRSEIPSLDILLQSSPIA